MFKVNFEYLINYNIYHGTLLYDTNTLKCTIYTYTFAFIADVTETLLFQTRYESIRLFEVLLYRTTGIIFILVLTNSSRHFPISTIQVWIV